MKKTDIALIILIAGASVLIAYFVARAIPGLGSANNQAVTVKTAEAISPDVIPPDPTIFNKDAINPTIESIIGNGTGQ